MPDMLSDELDRDINITDRPFSDCIFLLQPSITTVNARGGLLNLHKISHAFNSTPTIREEGSYQVLK